MSKKYYPSGKLNKQDEGATLIRIDIEKDVVIIDFGKELKWIGLYKEQAIQFAKMITDKAMDLPEQSK